VCFLAPSGPRHQASAQRAGLAPTSVEALAVEEVCEDFSFAAESGPALELRLALAATTLAGGRLRASLRVENRSAAGQELDRAGALRRSLISTHPILRLSAGRFVSPLESGSACENTNTWPVLAASDDDVMLGAAIVLPDHPQIAPESRGGLFDSTEIEEALLLHVHVMTDQERAEIEDPAVKEMIARAAAATPQDIIALHGRVTLRDPETNEPPTEPPGLIDPRAGEEVADVDGKRFIRGGKVIIRPAPDADLHARMLDGRTATVERIFTDYDGKVHFGVTIDDDPGQDLMRDTGRYLYFFAQEVEVVET
jgi:hypothetical protein